MSLSKLPGKTIVPSTNITVFGSSHVARLLQYCQSGGKTANIPSKPGINAELGLATGKVTWLGYGGLTALQADKHYHDIKDSNPDILIIILGGNDLDNGVHPESVGNRLYAMAKWLKIKQVYVCGIIPRPRPSKLSAAAFSRAAQACNAQLELLLGGSEANKMASPNIHFWKLKRLSYCTKQVHIRDQVHLNPLGNKRLYYNLNHAVQAGIKKLN